MFRRVGSFSVGLAIAIGISACPSSVKPPPPPNPTPDAGPSTGFLSVSVSPPTGLAGSVTVTGPDGFSRSLTQSTVLTVPPGSYSVAASDITGGDPIVPTVYSSAVTGSPASVEADEVGQIAVEYTPLSGSGHIWISGHNNLGTTTYAALLGFTPFGGAPDSPVEFSPSLRSPEGMALDSEGNIWVADDSLSAILKFSASQLRGGYIGEPAVIIVNTLDGGLKLDGGYNLTSPESPAFDREGNLWVADYSNNAILKYSNVAAMTGMVVSEPTALLFNGDAGILFDSVFGMAFDSSGNLWMSSYFLNQLTMYADPSALTGIVSPAPTVVISNVQDGGAQAFGRPTGLAFDSRNNLWIGNEFPVSVVELAVGQLATSGAVQPDAVLIDSLPSSPFSFPTSLAFDQVGNLWVGEIGQIAEFAASDISTAVGTEQLDAGWFFSGDILGGILIDPIPTNVPLHH